MCLFRALHFFEKVSQKTTFSRLPVKVAEMKAPLLRLISLLELKEYLWHEFLLRPNQLKRHYERAFVLHEVLRIGSLAALQSFLHVSRPTSPVK